MAASVVNSNAFVNSSGSSQNLGWTPTVGNWLIVAIGYNSSSVPTANTGWTRYDGVSVGLNLAGGLFYRQVQSGDTATITPTTNFSVIAPWAVWEIAGLPNGFPTDIQDFHMDFYLEGMKPMWAQNNGLILAASAARNASSVPVLSGVTFDHTHTAAYSGSRDSAVADKAVTAGTSFQIASTYPGAAYGYGIVILLNGDAAGTVPPGKIVRQTTRSTTTGDFRVFDLKYVPTVGNWLVAILSGNDASFSAATGWTQYDQNADAGLQMTTGVYYRQVQVGDTRSITLTNTASGNILTVSVLEFGSMSVGFPGAISLSYKYRGKTPSPSAASSGTLIVWSTSRGGTTTPVIAGTTYDTSYNYDYSSSWPVRTQALAIKESLSGSVTPTVTSPGPNDTAVWELVISPQSQEADPAHGTLTFTGNAPTQSFALSNQASGGALTFTGYAPTTQTTVSVPAGSLSLTGQPVGAYPPADLWATQFGLDAIGRPSADARSTQFGLTAQAINYTISRTSQAGLLALAINDTRTRITQMGLLVLAKGGVPPITPQPLSLAASGRSKIVDSRIVNMYYETTPDGPSVDARFGRGGLVSATQRGSGPITALFDWQGYQFTVSGNSVWRDSENIGSVHAGADTRFATSDNEIVIVTGGQAYYVTLTDVVPMSDTDIPDPVIDVIVRTNGRFVYLSDTGRWYYSEVGDARNIDPLSFATADQAPDNLVAALNVQDSFALFGTNSVEWWYDTGNDDAPFVRSQGRLYHKGLASRQTLVEADNTGFFLGSDRVVYRMGADPQRVSTYDVEDKIRRVPQADLDKSWAFATFFGGHTWYVLSLPGQSTWAFDISQNKWQEWKSWNRENFRVRVANGAALGDQYTGTIMSMDAGTYTDLGEPLERIVGCYLPVRAGAQKNFNLMLGCLRGVGLLDGYGADPHVEMRYSDSEGRLWSGWMEAPLGNRGVYDESAKAIWTQLGAIKAPGRLYEFRCTDPVEFTPYVIKYNEVRP